MPGQVTNALRHRRSPTSAIRGGSTVALSRKRLAARGGLRVAGVPWSLRFAVVLALMMLAGAASSAMAMEHVSDGATDQPAALEPLRVGVLPFEAGGEVEASAAAEVRDAVARRIGQVEGLELVAVDTALPELPMAVGVETSTLAADWALQVGKANALDIVVTGRAFTHGQAVFIAGRVLGVETLHVDGVLARSRDGVSGLESAAADAADRLIARIRAAEPAYREGVLGPLDNVREALRDRQLPRVFLAVGQPQVIEGRPTLVACGDFEQEVKLLLEAVGVEVIVVGAQAEKGQAIAADEARLPGQRGAAGKKGAEAGLARVWQAPAAAQPGDWLITGLAMVKTQPVATMTSGAGQSVDAGINADFRVTLHHRVIGDGASGRVLGVAGKTAREADIDGARRAAALRAGFTAAMQIAQQLQREVPHPPDADE